MASIGRIFLVVGLSLALYAGLRLAQEASAQGASSSAATQPGSGSGLALQRSLAIYNFKTTGENGPRRGEEIYYFKCWMCHNSYTIKAGTGAVPLKDLFKRPKLVTTGQPVNDQTVAEKIKNGGPGMPAYRYTLSDTDLADLLSYLRDARCCFEGDDPPRNPWYRY